jgi:hypothetical protein
MSNPNKHFWGECPALYTRARMQDVSAAIDRLESLLARGGDGAAAYLYELGALKLGAGLRSVRGLGARERSSFQ